MALNVITTRNSSARREHGKITYTIKQLGTIRKKISTIKNQRRLVEYYLKILLASQCHLVAIKRAAVQ
jgi:hypothetical protein